MITITQNQYDSLGKHLEENFYDELKNLLSQSFFGEFNKEEIINLIAELRLKSQKYSIFERSSLEYLLQYMISNGVNFEEEKKYLPQKKILSSNDLSGEDKIKKIFYLDAEKLMEIEDHDQ